VANVQEFIGRQLLGMPATDQACIDQKLCELDGTPTNQVWGANAILGVSLAALHAGASSRKLPLWRYLDTEGKASLPLPMVNMIAADATGGNLDCQDFLLLPIGAPSSRTPEDGHRVYRALGDLAQKGYEGTLVGDEGGYGPRLESNEEAIEVMSGSDSDKRATRP